MGKKKKELSMLVVASKIKEVNAEDGLRSSGDLAEGVSNAVHQLLERARERCVANGRSTVRSEDL